MVRPNDYIKKEAEEVAVTLGVNVLAIDLYDGKVATNNEEASKYVQSVVNSRAVNIILGARDYAGSGAVFATYGWCFGGAWSNQAAIELGVGALRVCNILRHTGTEHRTPCQTKSTGAWYLRRAG